MPKKKRPQPLPRSSKAGRIQRDMEMFANMKRSLAAMPPDTIMHVGEQMVMTEDELQRHIDEVSDAAKAAGLTGKFGLDDPSADVYAIARASLGLVKMMTAADLLAGLEAQTISVLR